MKKATILMVAAILGIFISTTGFASGNKAVVRVSASVSPVLSQKIIYQTGSITISPAEVEKGYLDVSAGTILEVKSNDPNGFLLSFVQKAGFINEVWVQEKGRTVILPEEGGFVHQPFFGGYGEVKEISYRFYLKPGTEPGRYAWPLQVMASNQ